MRFKEHQRACVRAGIDEKICEEVNRWMDEPVRWLGPWHRAERHSIEDCLRKAIEYAVHGWDKANQAFSACILHLALDDMLSK